MKNSPLRKYLCVLVVNLLLVIVCTPSFLFAVQPEEVEKIDWGANPQSLDIDGEVGELRTYQCPSHGKVSQIYGTNRYSAGSSICTAAAHMGLISVREGGRITVKITAIPNKNNFAFFGYLRNGIESHAWNGRTTSFVFVDSQGNFLERKPVENPITWSSHLGTLGIGDNIGQTYTYYCPSNGVESRIYGTGQYSETSSICLAATHFGLIGKEVGGYVQIRVEGDKKGFDGTTRNGVKSLSWDGTARSYTFLQRK